MPFFYANFIIINFSKAVVRWIAENGTDPLSRQTVTTADIIPNRNLKDAIEKWKLEQNTAT